MSDHAGTITDAAAATSGPRLPDGRVPILISSDTAELVVEEAAAIRDWVRAHPDVDPARVGAHLLRTRPARRHRALVIAVDHSRLVDALDALAAGRVHPDVVRGAGAAAPRRIAYTYPGQGSQRPGMGTSYYRLSEHYRREVDTCHEQSMRLFGSSPRDYVLGELDADDPSATDVRTIQPALFMQMAGLTAMWDAAGATPALTVGHSQGEIAAAYRSGAMTLSDALTIVTIRARLVHELSPRGHTMAVVGIDVDECEDMLARNSGWAQLSVVNSAHILCISGKREAVLGMVDTLSAQGKFAKEIRVEYPAHTSIVSEYQPAFLDALGTYLENESMLAGTMPCIGATLGGAVDETMSLGDYWFWNLRNRVRFDKAMTDAAVGHRADFFIEMSEHPTLLLAMGETLSDVDEAGLAARPVIGTSRRDAVGLEEFTRNVAAVAVTDSGFRWEALQPADTAISTPNRRWAGSRTPSCVGSTCGPIVRRVATTRSTARAGPRGRPAMRCIGWSRRGDCASAGVCCRRDGSRSSTRPDSVPTSRVRSRPPHSSRGPRQSSSARAVSPWRPTPRFCWWGLRGRNPMVRWIIWPTSWSTVGGVADSIRCPSSSGG
ncbi:acyltransferase domain-containing protein [Gordonia insulae]|uniref:6-deoxyerythronolide-B synthase EryA1, modules 1 and 2 n=1 Tax=Gordonia insulae TaxID=2420509 RepID=A0A3G8JMG5_9ACTN|nr:acyltransferase domain-containing protein [Gordonia insulae]AZG46281.1 6-deoxyerythronolide-B synthase EryA1, modules 1 and 2 [Gordonia insulae]